MAAWVQPCEVSQSANSLRSRVVVEKVRTSWWTGAETQRTAATTVSLWTSNPAQRGYSTCIGPPHRGERSPRHRNLLVVLRGLAAGGHSSGCSQDSGSNY